MLSVEMSAARIDLLAEAIALASTDRGWARILHDLVADMLEDLGADRELFAAMVDNYAIRRSAKEGNR